MASELCSAIGTLDNFESADPISHLALIDGFRHWGESGHAIRRGLDHVFMQPRLLLLSSDVHCWRR